MKIENNITKADIPEILKWYNAENSKYICEPSEKWIEYLKNDYVYSRKITSDDVIIGYIQIDIKDNNGYVCVFINPDFQKKGFATQLLNNAEEDLKGKIGAIVGYVEPDNVKALNMVKKLGYEGDMAKVDKDGFVEFKKNVEHDIYLKKWTPFQAHFLIKSLSNSTGLKYPLV